MSDIVDFAREVALDPEKPQIRCSFCCKSTKEVKKMVRSDETDANICDECVQQCVELMRL